MPRLPDEEGHFLVHFQEKIRMFMKYLITDSPLKINIFLKQISLNESVIYSLESKNIQIEIAKGKSLVINQQYMALLHRLINSKMWKLIGHGYSKHYSYATIAWQGEIKTLMKI